MQQKTNLHYRWNDNDELIVKKTNGKRHVFKNARDVYHSNGDVIVTTALGLKVRIDSQTGNKHY